MNDTKDSDTKDVLYVGITESGNYQYERAWIYLPKGFRAEFKALCNEEGLIYGKAISRVLENHLVKMRKKKQQKQASYENPNTNQNDEICEPTEAKKISA